MALTLPAHPNHERLRREARALQRACLAGEPDAARRLLISFPNADPRELALTTAQTVIAREYGFVGWSALKTAVDARRLAKPRSAAAVDAEALAVRWFELAEASDLRALARALAVGKRREESARAVMQVAPVRYAAFQQTLVGGLASRQARTRFECAAALDRFGDATTREPLARLMDDPVPRVRWMAMHALSCHACGGKSGPLEDPIRERIIAAALGDPSTRVRQHAAVALGLAHETRAAPVLREMLAREANEKLLRGVAWALSELTRPAKAAPAGV